MLKLSAEETKMSISGNRSFGKEYTDTSVSAARNTSATGKRENRIVNTPTNATGRQPPKNNWNTTTGEEIGSDSAAPESEH